MDLRFLPGQLHLYRTELGVFKITICGEEVFSNRSEKKAILYFNKLRSEMEAKFPAHVLTPQQKQELLMRDIARSQPFSTVARERKKKYVKGSTNTFG